MLKQKLSGLLLDSGELEIQTRDPESKKGEFANGIKDKLEKPLQQKTWSDFLVNNQEGR